MSSADWQSRLVLKFLHGLDGEPQKQRSGGDKWCKGLVVADGVDPEYALKESGFDMQDCIMIKDSAGDQRQNEDER